MSTRARSISISRRFDAKGLLVSLALAALAACGGSSVVPPPAPSCTDGIQNQGESAVDCGGTSSCEPCALGSGCTSASYCQSGACVGSVCASPTCSDHVRDGDETDVDCGGS